MRGPLRDHLFVRTAAAVATTTGTTASMPFRPATKLTTQMIVMTCFFEKEEEEKTPPRHGHGRVRTGAGGGTGLGLGREAQVASACIHHAIPESSRRL